MRSILTFVFIGFFMTGWNHMVLAQQEYKTQYLEVSMGFDGSRKNGSLSYQYAWNLDVGERRAVMMQIALGARLTSYHGSKEFFATVPEMIYDPARAFLKNIPDPDPGKKDSVFVPSSQIHCLNVVFSLGFQLKKWIRAGINGDMIGYSFGPQQQGVYINGSQAEVVTVTPEHYNCFWVGKGDQSGMLMIELFVAVQIADRLEIKLAGQGIDMEYRTDREVQTYPRPNDRFRYKSSMWSAGFVYSVGKRMKKLGR